MANSETSPERNKDIQWSDSLKRNKVNDRIWTGIILVLVGSAFLARSFDVPLPAGLFSWQCLLITIGILSGIKNKFQDSTWFILILIGSAFLVNDYYYDIQLRKRLWPLIIICIGAFFIFRSRIGRKGRRPDHIEGKYENDRSIKGESNFADINIVFSGINKIHTSENFAGGNITAIFAGGKLDLSKSDIKDKAVINFTTICGGLELIIPPDWTVKSQLSSILSAVHDIRDQSSSITEDPDKLLILQGTALFAGIEIRSYGTVVK